MKATSFLNTTVVVSALPAIPAHEITGWADGDDVLMLTRRNDGVTDKIGADGRMSISISADRSAEITLKLMSTSRSNKVLGAIYALQENGPQRFAPVNVLFQDKSRQDMGAGSYGYIKKLPDVQRGAGVNTQEWVIVVERLDLLLGDPAFVGLATLAAEAQ
jgi:hypothetical protein